eukprot:6374166-Pyramimonas_sp.AAC.1
MLSSESSGPVFMSRPPVLSCGEARKEHCFSPPGFRFDGKGKSAPTGAAIGTLWRRVPDNGGPLRPLGR